MGTPYKMKGSPMQRNFNISPAKNKTGKGTVSLRDAKGGRGSLDFWNQTPAEKVVASRRATREHYVANDNFSKNKKPANFSMKGGKTTTPDFSTTKLGKAKKRLDKAKKIFKKTAKFASSKVILPLTVVDAAYTAGMGNPKSAKATDKALKKEGKNKLKGINKTHVPKY